MADLTPPPGFAPVTLYQSFFGPGCYRNQLFTAAAFEALPVDQRPVTAVYLPDFDLYSVVEQVFDWSTLPPP